MRATRGLGHETRGLGWAQVSLLCLQAVTWSASVARAGEPQIDQPEGIVEAAGGALLVVDKTTRALLRVDPVTGEASVVSDDSRGGGPAFSAPVDVAVEANDSVLVADTGLIAVLRVDPVSGDRSVVTDPVTGGGLRLVEPLNLVVEEGGSIVVLDTKRLAVVRVDPVSGDRTVVSDRNIGMGPLLSQPEGLGIRADGTLLAGDGRELVAIDPASGDRAFVTGPRLGSGKTPIAIIDAVVLGDGRIVLLDDVACCPYLIEVDPETGNRERLSGRGEGGGPDFEDPRGVAVTADGLMVTDAGLDGIVRVDLTDGSRYVLGAPLLGSVDGLSLSHVLCRNETTGQQVQVETMESQWDCEELGLAVEPGDLVFTGASGTVDVAGEGEQFQGQAGVAVEADGRVAVIDNLREALFRVDPQTGDRVILSDDRTGTGLEFGSPHGVAIESGGSLLVTDSSKDAVLRADPMTGDRTVVSRRGVGEGEEFVSPRGIEVAPDGRLLLVDQVVEALFEIDPVTGDRTIASGPDVGLGPEFLDPQDLAIEADGHYLVTNDDLSSLFRVDAATGDRTILAEGLGSPWGVVLEADGHALVADRDLEAVLRVDAMTGEWIVVSDANTGSGPPLLDGPNWIALEADGRILVTDGQGLFRVDPVSGDREYLSGPLLDTPGGSLSGLEFPVEVICINRTTGLEIRFKVGDETEWKCNDLDFTDGDEIFTGARGVR